MRVRTSTSIAALALQVVLWTAPGTGAAQGAAKLPIRAASPEVFQAVSQFYEYDRKAPLQAEVIGKDETPGYRREKIVFTGIQRSRVPGYLALPKRGTGPFPVVMLIDGMAGSKDRWFQEDSWPRGTLVTSALVESGFAVLALDAPYHGERAAENDFRIPQATAGQRDMMSRSIVEHRRAMDYLATRPEIDTSRVGALGVSGGGIVTFALAGMDPRIRAAVAGVTPVGMMRAPIAIPIAPHVFAGAITETPFLMIMGRKDFFYTVEEAQQLFETIRSPRKELILYEGDHRPLPEYAAQSAAWFRQHLKPN